MVEIIVVIALMGFMAVGIMTVINPGAQFQKAADTQRKNDLSQIRKALESYYNDNGSYPSSTDFKINDGTTPQDWGTDWPPYLDTIPEDPSSSTKNYVYWSDGQSFKIYASLDRGAQDPSACNAGAACTGLPIGASCGSGDCNYGVSSPNISP